MNVSSAARESRCILKDSLLDRSAIPKEVQVRFRYLVLMVEWSPIQILVADKFYPSERILTVYVL